MHRNLTRESHKMTHNLQPIFDRLLIEEIPQSSIIVLNGEDSDIKPIYGKVLSTGKGMFVNGEHKPTEASPGDTVLFHRGASVKITHKGKDFFIIREEAILCLVKDQDNDGERTN